MSYIGKDGVLLEIEGVPASMFDVEIIGSHTITDKSKGMVELTLQADSGRADINPTRRFVARVRTNP